MGFILKIHKNITNLIFYSACRNFAGEIYKMLQHNSSYSALSIE